MTNLKTIKILSIHAEVGLGASIDRAAKEAIELAGDYGCFVTFKFNDKLISCEPWDTVEGKVAQYFVKE